MKLLLTAKVNEDDLITAITEYLDTYGMVDFIKKLDEEYNSWSVTKTLQEYFNKEMEKFNDGASL
jgi:hypothetical protein